MVIAKQSFWIAVGSRAESEVTHGWYIAERTNLKDLLLIVRCLINEYFIFGIVVFFSPG